jgi:intraflagellar transport protein 52
VVFAAPRENFDERETKALIEFLDRGGSVFLLASEGDENRSNDHYQKLLEPFGISVCNDSVARTVYFRYFHPKEALINNAFTSSSIESLSGRKVHYTVAGCNSSIDTDDDAGQEGAQKSHADIESVFNIR